MKPVLIGFSTQPLAIIVWNNRYKTVCYSVNELRESLQRYNQEENFYYKMEHTVHFFEKGELSAWFPWKGCVYMFLSRVKAKGKYYFYIYIYDNKSESYKSIIYRLGERSKALEVIKEWNTKNNIPLELLTRGLEKESIETWKKKIEEVS